MHVDTLITGAVIITMDAERRVLADGAIAIAGDRIVAVGPSAEITPPARETIDGRGFLVTPGLINSHVHITETLIRGVIPEDLPFEEELGRWVIPLYKGQTAAEQILAAKLAIAAMLRTGTTTFVEAGTILAFDAVMAAIAETGIRARTGRWAEDRAWDPAADAAALTHNAIAALEQDCAAHPDDGRLIAAWPHLIGHNTATDGLWRAAAAIAERHHLGLSAHMSPAVDDSQWYLAHEGARPIVHLDGLGVLSPRLNLVHMVHVDADEVARVARSGASITFCPGTALKCGYGATRIGLYPEMAAAGINLLLGTDGADTHDLIRAMGEMAGMFKDARQDRSLFGGDAVLAMATLNAAQAMGMAETIGHLAPGMKADLVLHDINRPEWRPLNDPVRQLIWSADGRSVHSVWVDGQRVVAEGRCTRIDEAALYAEAQVAAADILARSGLPVQGMTLA